MYTYDIEQLLKDGSAIRLKPQGYSMYPLFHPGRDEPSLRRIRFIFSAAAMSFFTAVNRAFLCFTGSAALLRMAFIWSGTIRPKSKGRSARIRSVGS